jgi:hypothetical protein
MCDWPPVILGTDRPELDKVLEQSLKRARDAGFPNAHKVTVSTSTGDPLRVRISGLEDDAAKALWKEHIEPMVAQIPGVKIESS